MDRKTPSEWYLDIGGRRTGPYSTEQILGLVKAREILANHLISSNPLNGRWISIQEFTQSFAQGGAPAQPKSGGAETQTSSMTLPPRPPEVEEKTTGIIMRPPGFSKSPDATTSLFDALQAVREKQTLAKMPPPPRNLEEASRFPWLRKIPSQAWLIIGVTSLIWLILLAFYQSMGAKAPSTPPNSAAVAPFGNPPANGPARTFPTQNPSAHSGNSSMSAAPPMQPARPAVAPMKFGHADPNDPRREDAARRDRDERDERDDRNADQNDRLQQADAPQSVNPSVAAEANAGGTTGEAAPPAETAPHPEEPIPGGNPAVGQPID